MTKHEQLMENYEDALLALLMERAIEEQGTRFLEENERLKNDTEFSIAAGLNRKINRLINRTFREGKADKMWRFTGRLIRRAAVIALVATLLFTTAFAASESVRAATLNFVSAAFYDHMEIRLVEKDMPPAESNSLDFEVGWLPDGFELSDSSGDDSFTWSEYRNIHGEEINISLFLMRENSVFYYDTENAVIEDIQINGLDAKIITKNYIQIVIPIENRGLIITISGEGENLSTKELITIAENIVI